MRTRMAALVLVMGSGTIALGLLWPKASMGFYEDYPASAPDRSTAHWDLTKALAYCAGFGANEAETIADADEATDVESYGSVTFHFAKRTGPNMQYFHFPGLNNTLGELTSWTSGVGNLSLDAGSCFTCCGPTGMDGGDCVMGNTKKALGILLHSVGDYWSHKACVDNGGTGHSATPEYCKSSAHDCEWGPQVYQSGFPHDVCDTFNETQVNLLRSNALNGLKAIRNVLDGYAASWGKTERAPVSDSDLASFAILTTASARRSKANDIYAACGP